MSQILKAKNRILNRSKIITPQPQSNQQNNDPYSNYHHQLNQQTFQPQSNTLTYNKKFNISSISMKFMKNQQQQQQLQLNNNQTSSKNNHIKLNLTQTNKQQQFKHINHIPFNINQKRQKSPEFSHTERINPIRHFQPYNLSTLSQSNSQSSLYKWSKNKSRRIQRSQDQQFQKRSDVRTTLQKHDYLINESPINKIKKTVHSEQLNLLIVKQQNKRAQSPFKPKQCRKEYTETIISEVQQKQKPFIDDTFPPGPTIMFPRKSLYSQQQGLIFQRLQKIYESMDLDVVLMQRCEPTLINPGKYTNPCLYSALRILSQYPQKILSLFQNQKKNDQGIYYVRICKDGTWRYILVDDKVPVKLDESIKKHIQILGFHSIDMGGIIEIWPSIIQKALAKIYSTYYDLLLSRRDGLCPLLRALTGFPISKYDLIKDVRSYLVLIDSALKKDHIVILQQVLPQFEYLAQLKGLAVEESYQVLQIQKNCFVLRNLADFDLVTKLTFDEVMMFSSLLLFRKQQNYTYISQKLRHKKGYFSIIKVKIPENTLCYWDVWQNNPAYYKNHLQNKIDYQVAPFKILIQPLIIQNIPIYDSISQPQTIVESGKQISMKKGQYLVYIHLCQTMQQIDFTISYYGEKDVEIQRVKNYKQKWGQKCCENTIM